MLNLVKQEQPATQEATFADFWLLYPRKVNKMQAEKVWTKLTGSQRVDAMVSLVDWRRVWIARDEMEFVPHARTWLFNQRWLDELPSDCTPRHASHVPAKPHLESERGEMPASVRDAIARIRGKAA